MKIYYVAECLGGDFDNIPISMFGQPALFTEREAADKFCAFANGSGRVHEVREWECRAAGREEAVAVTPQWLSDQVCEARNQWAIRHECDWLEDSGEQVHPDDFIGQWIYDRLQAAGARPTIAPDAGDWYWLKDGDLFHSQASMNGHHFGRYYRDDDRGWEDVSKAEKLTRPAAPAGNGDLTDELDAISHQIYLAQSRLSDACDMLRTRSTAGNGGDIERMDRVLRSSVPDRWKGCTSPVGAVQSYIAELEQALMAITGATDVDDALAKKPGADLSPVASVYDAMWNGGNK